MKTYLTHHGIPGMKWGVRRFQNEDGSLTKAGEKRYTVNEDGSLKKKPLSTGAKVAIGVGATVGAAAVGTGIAYAVSKSNYNKNIGKSIDLQDAATNMSILKERVPFWDRNGKKFAQEAITENLKMSDLYKTKANKSGKLYLKAGEAKDFAKFVKTLSDMFGPAGAFQLLTKKWV